MKKKADSHSDQYFEAAIKGLRDQYTKSYFAGLKGMYDMKPKKTDADYSSLYQTSTETGSDLVRGAHPKSIVLSDAMGKGGLVENGIEQQLHNIDVALSKPTGNLTNRHANLLQAIKKVAKEAEKDGSSEASKILNELTVKLSKLTKLSKEK